MKPRLHGWHLPVLHRAPRSLSLFFSFFPFFNDRCCVSATRGTHYVTFPAVSAAAVEAATAGAGIITGNTVCDANQKNFAVCCLSGPACFLVSGESQCHWDSIFRDFIHDKANSMRILFRYRQRGSTKANHWPFLTIWLLLQPAFESKLVVKQMQLESRLNNIMTSTFGNGQTGVFPGFVSEPTLRHVLTNVGLVCRELLHKHFIAPTGWNLGLLWGRR